MASIIYSPKDIFEQEFKTSMRGYDRKEVDEFLDRLGKTAVEFDKANGNYRNRTGNLRRSNYSNVHDHTLTIGNKAEYASDVSSRGYDVIDSGIQYIKKEIEDMR